MDKQERLRTLPKVDELLKRPDAQLMLQANPRALVVESFRDAVETVRSAILADEEISPTDDEIACSAGDILAEKTTRSLVRVINATGIVIHTNLGRSPLSEAAVAAVADVARGYSTLEYDLAGGERGSRHAHVESLIARLTGAEAAMAVNNNAAAVMMVLSALACGKEVVVSRGQLVEIGGSFRVPDIMSQSGATMVEVGTTNKTHLRDYGAAITPSTGLLLKVHSSNFRVVGFTQEVPLADLVALGAENAIPVYEDQGSGVLVDLAPYGLPDEPTVASSIEAGVDVVSASGDKLLGGPQAGIIAGKWHVIDTLKKHPLARAMRLDKMTLAALEVTLRQYLDPEEVFQRIPTLRMLTVPAEEVRSRAAAMAERLGSAPGVAAGLVADVSRAGGGSLPLADIPTFVVEVAVDGTSATEVERALRLGDPHVIARIKEDRILLDPRTLAEDEIGAVCSAVERIAGGA